MTSLPSKELILKRLKKHIRYEGNHWLWVSSTRKGDYGVIGIENRQYTVSRLVLAVYLGLDYYDYSWQANHKVECQIPRCCSPACLYKGTHSENVQDSVKLKTQHWASKTHCPRNHEYTPENTIHYVNPYTGVKQRQCIICNRELGKIRQKKYQEKRGKAIRDAG